MSNIEGEYDEAIFRENEEYYLALTSIIDGAFIFMVEILCYFLIFY